MAKCLHALAEKCKLCWKHVTVCNLDEPCECFLESRDYLIRPDHCIISASNQATFKPVPYLFACEKLGKPPMKMNVIEPQYALNEALYMLHDVHPKVVKQIDYEKKLNFLNFHGSFISSVGKYICKGIRIVLCIKVKCPEDINNNEEKTEFNLLIHSVPAGYGK